MKKNLWKRLGALLLVMALLLSFSACGLLGGFGSNDDYSYEDDDDDDDRKDKATEGTEATQGQEAEPTEPAAPVDELSDSRLRYVMIYNPKIYDENSYTDKSALSVGTLGSQVDPLGNRGDGLATENEFTSIPQIDWFKDFPTDIEVEGDRADPMGRDYTLGQTRTFMTGSDFSRRTQETFRCAYVGRSCYIWVPASGADLSQAAIAAGQEFDNHIYQPLVTNFGTPRFVGTVGKVNLVFYNMGNSLLGYFAPAELLTEAEMPYFGITNTSVYNTGDALVHINSRFLGTGNPAYDNMIYSTMAHEFQHLLNFSAAMQTSPFAMMNTWINEAFSGYIEDQLYTGAKETAGQLNSFNTSELIRNGQSLYNFTTNTYDIGVYGSVYYFTQYLEKLAGKNIFSDITTYWRESYSSTLTVPEALAKAVSPTVYNQIDNSIDYSGLNLRFNSDEEEWMSKLTLNFYLNMFSGNSGIPAYTKIDREALLFDSIDGAKIEGGGRIIVALSDTTFKIPAGSDDGLVYVGLDENFQPITDFIYG